VRVIVSTTLHQHCPYRNTWNCRRIGDCRRDSLFVLCLAHASRADRSTRSRTACTRSERVCNSNAHHSVATRHTPLVHRFPQRRHIGSSAKQYEAFAAGQFPTLCPRRLHRRAHDQCLRHRAKRPVPFRWAVQALEDRAADEGIVGGIERLRGQMAKFAAGDRHDPAPGERAERGSHREATSPRVIRNQVWNCCCTIFPSHNAE
jgi:hypothetical protein